MKWAELSRSEIVRSVDFDEAGRLSVKGIRVRVSVTGASKGAVKCLPRLVRGGKQGVLSMAQPFGHEKLIVYQKGMRFVAVPGALLDRLPRRVAVCDPLDRGKRCV